MSKQWGDVEFCRMCGASFPPKEGEGICKDWGWCMLRSEQLLNIAIGQLEERDDADIH